MTDEDVVFSTAETELMTLRMQVEYWRLEAQRLADLLADLEQAERQERKAWKQADLASFALLRANFRLAKADKLAESAKLVCDLDQRERFGDETLDGFEWGRATSALRAALVAWETE